MNAQRFQLVAGRTKEEHDVGVARVQNTYSTRRPVQRNYLYYTYEALEEASTLSYPLTSDEIVAYVRRVAHFNAVVGLFPFGRKMDPSRVRMWLGVLTREGVCEMA